MRFYFWLMALAFFLVALSGAALAWDGSYVLFKLLDRQDTFVVHNRWQVVPLQLIVLLTANFTQDINLLKLSFGLAYAAIPLLGLFLAWWVVRRDARPLFVWAAFGISLGTLPGQLCLVADANQTLQLTWPLILATLTGLRRWQFPAIGLAAIIMVIAHPNSVIMFGVVAGLAVIVGWQRPDERKRMWLGAGFFLLLSVITIIKFAILRTDYEESQLSLTTLEQDFSTAVWGLPLIAMVFGWIAASAVYLKPRLKEEQSRQIARIVGITSLLVVVGALVIWARNPYFWERGLDFRTWALPLSLPFVGLATLEALRYGSKLDYEVPGLWKSRVRTIRTLGGLFLVVMAAQSLAWVILSGKLETAINQTGYVCNSQTSTRAFDNTPFDHWSISAYSLLSQGRNPRRVMLENDGCADKRMSYGLPMAQWDARPWQGGWFNLQPLQQDIKNEPEQNTGCWLPLSSGWYDYEQNDEHWWRWTKGQAQIQVRVPKDTTINLRADFHSLKSPNQVNVLLNGQLQTSLKIDQENFVNLKNLALALKAGGNLVEFTSTNPSSSLPNDPRNLGILIQEPELNLNGKVLKCELRP